MKRPRKGPMPVLSDPITLDWLCHLIGVSERERFKSDMLLGMVTGCWTIERHHFVGGDSFRLIVGYINSIMFSYEARVRGISWQTAKIRPHSKKPSCVANVFVLDTLCR